MLVWSVRNTRNGACGWLRVLALGSTVLWGSVVTGCDCRIRWWKPCDRQTGEMTTHGDGRHWKAQDVQRRHGISHDRGGRVLPCTPPPGMAHAPVLPSCLLHMPECINVPGWSLLELRGLAYSDFTTSCPSAVTKQACKKGLLGQDGVFGHAMPVYTTWVHPLLYRTVM